MAKQRNVADASNDEHEQGQGEDKDSEGRGDREGGSDEVAVEVLADIVPVSVVLLGEVERVQSQRVDRLTGAVSEEEPLPTCGTGELRPACSLSRETYS